MRREATNTPGRPPTAGILRAALLGLSAGMLLGGLALMALGMLAHLRPMDCGYFAEEECAFTRDTAQEMGRVQGVSGAALLALGLATAVFVSRGKPPPEEPGEQARGPK